MIYIQSLLQYFAEAPQRDHVYTQFHSFFITNPLRLCQCGWEAPVNCELVPKPPQRVSAVSCNVHSEAGYLRASLCISLSPRPVPQSPMPRSILGA